MTLHHRMCYRYENLQEKGYEFQICTIEIQRYVYSHPYYPFLRKK